MPDPEPNQKADPSLLCERCQSPMISSHGELTRDQRVRNTYQCAKCGFVSRIDQRPATAAE
jgi:RNase P subunit RPR2